MPKYQILQRTYASSYKPFCEVFTEEFAKRVVKALNQIRQYTYYKIEVKAND